MAKKQHIILVNMPTLHEIIVRAGSNFWLEVPHPLPHTVMPDSATEDVGRGRDRLSLIKGKLDVK